MRLSDFDYELPEGAIAHEPARPRDSARLLVFDRASGAVEHRTVRDLPSILRRGDVLVVNDTRVLPARLMGQRKSGGQLEVLALGPAPTPGLWRALVKPAKRLARGEVFELEGGAVRARAVQRGVDEDGTASAEWWIELVDPADPSARTEEVLERHGRMPLPPYLRRARGEEREHADDRERYQTVFADRPGAVAAPTAGLHFTPELFARLAAAGIERERITLHVGLGTFQPIAVEDLSQHVMHSEDFELAPSTATALENARARGGRIVAVGTTSARTLESCARPDGTLRAGAGSTRLFVTPGHAFRAVDALLTNFHLPRSTLLMLVAAFAGRERVLALYREALERGYRFYSFGDAMLIV